MTPTPLLLAFLAHFSADFLLQSDRMVQARTAGRVWPYLAHAGTVAAVLFVLLHFYGVGAAAFFAILVAGLHLILDWLKDLLGRKGSPRVQVALFVGDQVLHGLVLFFSWQWLAPRPDPRVLYYYGLLVPPRAAAVFGTAQGTPAIELNLVLAVVLVYVAVMFAGAVLLRKILDALGVSPRREPGDDASAGRIGKYIGILERGLILTLVLADVVSAVGFVVAAKSVARFKELDEKGFAEYYLVGTLASTLLAVGAGLLLKAALRG